MAPGEPGADRRKGAGEGAEPPGDSQGGGAALLSAHGSAKRSALTARQLRNEACQDFGHQKFGAYAASLTPSAGAVRSKNSSMSWAGIRQPTVEWGLERL